MWSDNTAPALSLENYAKMMRLSVSAAKARIEEDWRLRREKSRRVELRAAAARQRQGPRRVVEALGDARPVMSMSKLRYVELHRASLIERGAKGGELLGNDSDFTEWMLKRPDMEHLKVTLAKTTNKTGWTPSLANLRLQNAAAHGRKERAGRAIFDPQKGAWI